MASNASSLNAEAFDNRRAGFQVPGVNKRQLVTTILEQLRDDLALYQKAAGAARAEATDEQSKAENKYDTRGLEASYLARGQSRQAAELAQAIEQFEKLAVRDFSESDPIDTGAFVELQNGKETNHYFIGPRAGGTEVTSTEPRFW